MKVYVYVVEVYNRPKFVCATIEDARKALLDKGFSCDESLKSVEEMQAEMQKLTDADDFIYMQYGYWREFSMYRKPIIGELPKPTNKVTINTDVFDVRITPKQLKQEQDELKSFDWQENEVEINHRIDQAKEDELGW